MASNCFSLQAKEDAELARLLQAQFDEEHRTEHPSNLVYKAPKRPLNTSRSLTDPSWEVVDPTPDIHVLFQAFAEKFFWNKLLSVCVSWSKRMTTCAGVCSYHGRGGMCSITLSEPLLKLRPRKDLVETLLHEMIHAYLFVTHNNKDRSGHGPEFHKHMFRINREAGTNITVYHDFHDEVRLYKQHWWRCNGPCQHRKPFFGMVRRATNRAPGPYDRWWQQHSLTCGGAFIKVKEPEKAVKKPKSISKEAKKDVKSGGDIRTFFPGAQKVTKKINGAQNGNEPSSAFLSVRDHWASKYSSTSKRSPTLDVKSDEPSTKIQRIDETNCPVCNQRMPLPQINTHLDSCLNQESPSTQIIDLTQENSRDKCPLCLKRLNADVFDVHVADCALKRSDIIEKQIEMMGNNDDDISCLLCGVTVPKLSLNAHLDDCMVGFKVGGGGDDTADEELQVNCPFCMKLFQEAEMKGHIDDCIRGENLAALFDEF